MSDLLDQLSDGPRGRRRQFKPVATEELTVGSVRGATTKAKGSSRVDESRKRHTIIVTDELIGEVERIGVDLALTKTDAWNLLIWLGLQAYRDGASLPLVEAGFSRKLNLPS